MSDKKREHLNIWDFICICIEEKVEESAVYGTEICACILVKQRYLISNRLPKTGFLDFLYPAVEDIPINNLWKPTQLKCLANYQPGNNVFFSYKSTVMWSSIASNIQKGSDINIL